MTRKTLATVGRIAGVSALALGLALGTTAFDNAVHAEGNGQQSGANAGNGGSKDGQGGAQSGQGNQGANSQGQGGPGTDSDGVGPQAGNPQGSGGGKPTWAQEGIPEVELGRLNVVRSPERVLDTAYDEAIASLTPGMVTFYSLSLDDAITQLSLNFDETEFIDSPLQNLALLKDALDGTSALTSAGVTNDIDTLMAIFLGAASDKTVPISTDTVTAVTLILGFDLTNAETVSLATAAEAIRIAILAGHG